MDRLILLIFATYGITLILTELDGPNGVFVKLRRHNYLKALRCHTCTAVYVGAVLALYTANSLVEWLITLMALAGASTWLDRHSYNG